MVVSLLASFALSLRLAASFSRPGSFFYVADHPNARSLHARPTSRSGGIAILAAIYGVAPVLLTLSGQWSALVWALGLVGLALAVVGYMDDRTPLAAGTRLVVHVFVAIGLVWAGFSLRAVDAPGRHWELTGWAGAAGSVIWIVWMINLYNFMDGIDGYAGGMAAIGFATLAYLGWLVGEAGFVLTNAIVAAAACGFLVVNFPPARIFMGDTGSPVLGCFAAGMVLWGAIHDIFPFWVGVLVFSPFIVDATATLLRRLARGERVWEPHATHYYQRLVRSGWGHRRTVLLQYAFMLGCSLSAVVALSASARQQWGILVLWAGIYAAYFCGVAMRESRVNRSSGSSGPLA